MFPRLVLFYLVQIGRAFATPAIWLGLGILLVAQQTGTYLSGALIRSLVIPFEADNAFRIGLFVWFVGLGVSLAAQYAVVLLVARASSSDKAPLPGPLYGACLGFVLVENAIRATFLLGGQSALLAIFGISAIQLPIMVLSAALHVVMTAPECLALARARGDGDFGLAALRGKGRLDGPALLCPLVVLFGALLPALYAGNGLIFRQLPFGIVSQTGHMFAIAANVAIVGAVRIAASLAIYRIMAQPQGSADEAFR